MKKESTKQTEVKTEPTKQIIQSDLVRVIMQNNVEIVKKNRHIG